ncbi:hypothetical protein SAMN05216345_102615 [Cupriavidus sp. YR651]|nr:hypothetical protein SAMN05216345_102615 [Cupriavidus sp. YR651]
MWPSRRIAALILRRCTQSTALPFLRWRVVTETCCTLAQLATIGITPQDVLAVFSWGFMSVVVSWSVGFAIGVAVDMIRKV